MADITTKTVLYLIRDVASGKIARVGWTVRTTEMRSIPNEAVFRETYDPPINVCSGEVYELCFNNPVSIA